MMHGQNHIKFAFGKVPK